LLAVMRDVVEAMRCRQQFDARFGFRLPIVKQLTDNRLQRLPFQFAGTSNDQAIGAVMRRVELPDFIERNGTD